MRTLLLWFLLLLAAGPVAAQAAPPARPAPAAATPPDTVAALHRLFAARRHWRNCLAGAGLVVGVAGFVAARQSYDLGGALVAVSTGAFGSVAAGASFAYYGAFGRAAEAQAVADFQAHRLAPWLRCRLRPRYFRAPRVRASVRRHTFLQPIS